MTPTSRNWDEEPDLDISLHRPSRGRVIATVVALVLGGLVALACLIAVIIGVMNATQSSTREQLIGSWKGRWVVGADTFDSIYTFNRDGSFVEDTFDIFGRPLRRSPGRWRMQNGEVEIRWANGGGVEHAAPRINGDTLNYRIVNHTDARQVGLVVNMQRQ